MSESKDKPKAQKINAPDAVVPQKTESGWMPAAFMAIPLLLLILYAMFVD